MATIYHTAASLDGFLADPDHGLEWLLQFQHPADSGLGAFLEGVGAVAMGSSTYEWVLRHHVMPPDKPAQPWPHPYPTWVFTTRELPRVEGAEIQFVRGDVRPVHQAMTAAAQGKHLWITGGGDLAAQFHDAGLLDELVVTIAPVTLGAGAPLFPRRLATPPMQLLEAKAVGEGFAELRYALPRAGS